MAFTDTLKKYGWKMLSVLLGEELPRKPKELYLNITLRIDDDFSSERHAREFLSTLIRRGGIFLPKWWEQEEKPHKVRFDPDDLSCPIKLWKSKSGILAGDLSMSYGPRPYDENQWVSVSTLGSPDTAILPYSD